MRDWHYKFSKFSDLSKIIAEGTGGAKRSALETENWHRITGAIRQLRDRLPAHNRRNRRDSITHRSIVTTEAVTLCGLLDREYEREAAEDRVLFLDPASGELLKVLGGER
jgi:hypothetical protein